MQLSTPEPQPHPFPPEGPWPLRGVIFYLPGSACSSLIAELGLRIVNTVINPFAPQLVAAVLADGLVCSVA